MPLVFAISGSPKLFPSNSQHIMRSNFLSFQPTVTSAQTEVSEILDVSKELSPTVLTGSTFTIELEEIKAFRYREASNTEPVKPHHS